ncbi:hypothetical protein DVR09_15955 (plasmid) [Erythrobacter aureus]|uniref:Uncharacterized protein n=2 Tax=Erythrobacter aureus TaxID=2182384 RepID=A0A345YJ45_9SPHN|nr:hypothetical protein DVR09_15955 [Erythrobacter aureus]
MTVSKGEDAGWAYLEGCRVDMIAYPPTGLGQKYGFRIFEPEDGESPEAFAERLLSDPASPVYGADAPAGCIPTGDEEFLFFGAARELSTFGETYLSSLPTE